MGLILIYNTHALGGLVTKFDWVCIAIMAANIFEVCIEIYFLKIYENLKINLELRNPLKS